MGLARIKRRLLFVPMEHLFGIHLMNKGTTKLGFKPLKSTQVHNHPLVLQDLIRMQLTRLLFVLKTRTRVRWKFVKTHELHIWQIARR